VAALLSMTSAPSLHGFRGPVPKDRVRNNAAS
jgi:hypothetical protein